MSTQKSEIKLDVNGQPVNAYLAAPERGGPGVLVLHAWWGLNSFFKDLCDRLAEQGYVAFAPDLLKGEIAETVEAAKEMTQTRDEQFVGDVAMVAKDHLVSLTKSKIGVIGFSMGAAWALVAASRDPENIAATVLFYGTYVFDFSNIKSKMLGHFAETDEWESMEDVKALEQGMKVAGVDFTMHIYPDAGHWFVETDRPEYDPAAASLAWDRTFEFLRKHL